MSRYALAAIKLILIALTFGLHGCNDNAGAGASTRYGIELTVSGPGFAQPQTFFVPDDQDGLSGSMSARRVNMQLSRKGQVLSVDGKHALQGLILGTDSGSGDVGTYTDGNGVGNAWFTFGINHGSDASESASMSFDYSKGERQPVSLVIEQVEERQRVVGHFRARVQRTNINHTDKFYDISGTFNLRSARAR